MTRPTRTFSVVVVATRPLFSRLLRGPPHHGICSDHVLEQPYRNGYHLTPNLRAQHTNFARGGPGCFFAAGAPAAAPRAARAASAARPAREVPARRTCDVRREGEPGRYIVKAVLRCKICKYKILALICHLISMTMFARARAGRGGRVLLGSSALVYFYILFPLWVSRPSSVY